MLNEWSKLVVQTHWVTERSRGYYRPYHWKPSEYEDPLDPYHRQFIINGPLPRCRHPRLGPYRAWQRFLGLATQQPPKETVGKVRWDGVCCPWIHTGVGGTGLQFAFCTDGESVSNGKIETVYQMQKKRSR